MFFNYANICAKNTATNQIAVEPLEPAGESV